MKLNYLSIFTLIFIFFLAMNFIAAEEIGENCTDEGLKIDLDVQDSISFDSNQKSISNHDENYIDDSNELLGSDNLNHIYVSPDGSGDGSSSEAPSSFQNVLNEAKDNTIVHMADGIYNISKSSKDLKCKNFTIMADNPGKVILNSIMTNNNYNFIISSCSNVTFKDIIFQGGSAGTAMLRIVKSNEVFIENCTFINHKNYGYIIFSASSEVYLNNCTICDNSIQIAFIQVGGGNVLINRG